MPNQFLTEPELSPGFPPDQGWNAMWECPLTGLVVPKHPVRNLQWRADMLDAADDDPGLQADLMAACRDSVLFYVNAFCWTLRVFSPSADGRAEQAADKHLPFVTWGIQDDHLLWIERCIDDGHDGLTDKSRDMGATWDHIAVYSHRFNFRDNESHLMLSRKEDAVDMLDGQPKDYPYGMLADPGTLFGKLDYIQHRLPDWMQPRMTRKKLHLVNQDTNTRIDGESANATAGSSDRRTSIFLDEMAKMREGESIKRSTRDVTACRLANSTPNGAGTAFSIWRLSGTVPVFVLPWWEHPEKGNGRYTQYDEATARWSIRSPWYNHEAKVRSPKELAIEVDMDHIGSGDTFFEEPVLEEHRRLYARPPAKTLSIDFQKGVSDDEIPGLLQRRMVDAAQVQPRGPWSLWCELPNGRPSQDTNYIIAADISKGQGASNSVVAVLDAKTREKVAEFADAHTPPYALARLVCAAALWFGGNGSLPFVIWENNGDPGFDFGRLLVHTYYYPLIYFHRQSGTIAEKKGKRYGWRSDREQKAASLGLLRRAYAHGGFINHSAAAIDEAKTYVHYDSGGIGPAELVEESESVRKAHGDRVIADMLLLVALGDAPVNRKRRTRPPAFSVAGRMQAHKQRQRQRRNQRTFDHR